MVEKVEVEELAERLRGLPTLLYDADLALRHIGREVSKDVLASSELVVAVMDRGDRVVRLLVAKRLGKGFTVREFVTEDVLVYRRPRARETAHPLSRLGEGL